jgi:excisionase family DNA binding protein
MHPREYAELKLASARALPDTLLTPAQRAFAVLGVGNTTGYKLIAEGKIVARKLGSRTMIETESLKAYVASLPLVPTKAA